MKSTRRILVVVTLTMGIVLLGAVAGCGKKSQSPQTDTTMSQSGSSSMSSSTSSSSNNNKSGSQLLAVAQKNRKTIESGKSNAETVTSPPKPVPQGTTQDGTTVTPPQPSGDSYQVWSFQAIDLDGDGDTEDGIAMVDASNTLYVWWSDTSWWSDDQLDGFLWLADQTAGFILVLDDAVGLACARADGVNSAGAGCIGCDDQGDCEAIAITATWNGGN